MKKLSNSNLFLWVRQECKGKENVEDTSVFDDTLEIQMEAMKMKANMRRADMETLRSAPHRH